AIAAAAVEKMCSLGALRHTVSAAIGPRIAPCCFEVGEDLYTAVSELRGENFAARHVKRTPSDAPGKFHADMAGMNAEILCSAGVSADRIDVSPVCTMCECEKFFSHRASSGIRGAQGAAIAILSQKSAQN
ncbi:MAG: polyphenol oxidase family protein, partial [Clostridia bacterium]|nr:polyphenol oxidase family protein [Clostridia bacterium]